MHGKNVILTISLLILSLGFIGGVGAQLVERGGPEISVDENDVTVTMHLYNPEATTSENILVELQLRTQHWPLATIGPQQVCNPSYPWNVHRMVSLNAGEASDVSITATRESGTYHLYLVSVDKCCVDQNGNEVTPACVDKSPYGLYGRYIGTVKTGSGGGVVPPSNPFQLLIDYWYITVIGIVMLVVGIILWKSDKGGRR